MKTLKQITVLFIIAITFNYCKDEVSTELRYMANVPIYMDRAKLKAAINDTEIKPLSKPGKIYIKDKYLFINEIGKGIHVFDNSNPASPQAVVFLNIPGNVDIAIKGNRLYADNLTDLVVIDISDVKNAKEVDRYKNAFPNYYPMYDHRYPIAPIDTTKGVVVGWKVEEITVKKVERQYYLRNEQLVLTDSKGRGSFAISANVGVAGSMARFAIKENILYVINNNSQLRVFDIGGQEITKKEKINMRWAIETLFIRGKNLFIGSRTGMFIYDISNVETPVFVSQYNHVTSCDPVVVNDEYAFITLRTGNNCNGTANQLDVVSLENIKEPKLVQSYNLFNPHGLGIDNNTLFICDGDAGLKIYDIKDVKKIDKNMLQHFKNIKTYDLIPYNNILIMTGSDGIYQYDYSDIKDIKQLSHIATE